MVGTVSTRSPYFPRCVTISWRATWKYERIGHTFQRLLERRQEMFGTRMERVPTARWNALRDRVAITLMFFGHKNETFFRWSLRLAFSTVALHRNRSAAVSKSSRSNLNGH